MHRRIVWLKNRSLQILLFILSSIASKKIPRPPIGFPKYLKDSGLLNLSEPNVDFDALRHWEQTDYFWAQGLYSKSVTLRKEILNELYERNGVGHVGYCPPGLSTGFIGPIGHQALLCTHVCAQDYGILDSREAILPIHKNDLNKPILQTVASKLRYLQYERNTGWSELPLNWHTFERLQMLRTPNGFIDLYELIERVFQTKEITPQNPLLEFSEGYVESARKYLESRGLPKDAWFVALHIRNVGNGNARRNQPISSYIPAIQEVIKAGGWVLRIGDASMEPFDNLDQFLDFAVSPDDASWVHPYILSAAHFFIGTSSGPASIPPLFGVPTLVTNATSIGRNILTSSKNSIYIPKQTSTLDGKTLSYSETLNSPDGFGELEQDELKMIGLRLTPNSAEDILRGVKEIMARINQTFDEDKTISVELEKIRKNFAFTSKGNLAQTYIERNPLWLN
jgi:putative glycosyltransferase (TIGR04372 family)